MRARTALAGTTLALLALVWSAPAALAADDGDKGATATTTASAPDDSRDHGNNDNTTPPKPQPAPITTKPAPITTKPAPTTTKPVPPVPLPSPVKTVTPGPIPAEPKATLSVSPNTVRPGETVTANPHCENGTQQSLSGAGVDFRGNSARIDQTTAEGNHTVTLVCANAGKKAGATANFQVVHTPNGQPLRASLAVSPGVVRPGDVIDSGAVCQGGHQDSLTGDSVRFNGIKGRVDQNAGDGDRTVTLVCTNGVKTDTATGHFRVDRNSGPGGEVHATLKLSPTTVRQGDVVYANGSCINGRQDALFGDDVSFRGDRGWVNDNAREGDHTVTRVCVNGPKRDVATDHFRVIRGDGGGNGAGPRDFWLSDRSGHQGDEVDVSVRCHDDRARLDSDVLDDITLRRDGGRLTGTTHVRNHVGNGWHRVTVDCDGHSDSTGFWVLRDRDHERYLDLNPGYGHRGDAIDVNVGCDSRIGSLDSDVLDDIDLDHDGRDWRYQGTTHVHDDAEAGEHTIKIRCGDDTLEESFFVQGDGDNSGDNGQSAGGGDTVSVYPKGAPETGGGPVNNGSPAGVLALGLTGVSGAVGASKGMSGAMDTDSIKQRGARR